MKKLYDAKCFQCGNSNTKIKSFINENGDKGYFCDTKCLDQFQNKDDSSFQTDDKTNKKNIESIRNELMRIVSSWTDNKYNSCYFGYICGLLSPETQQPHMLIITKAQTCYLISICQSERKLCDALNYAKTQDYCVIL